MVTGNQLRLAFLKYVFSFNNKRHYVLVPSLPMKMTKHRNDVPKSVNIITPKVATTQ